MRWLTQLVDEIVSRKPAGQILVESGASPSGTYHIGHLREILTCDAVVLELQQRGREARHVHYVDDLDALRKIPVNIPPEFEKYLGIPLCDVPSPDGDSNRSYGDYFLAGLLASAEALGIEMAVVHSHQQYRKGFFVPAIECALEHLNEARTSLETISGRQLDEHWSPIQVMEEGRLKNRRFVSLDKVQKQITYADSEGAEHQVGYDAGMVKLDWRLDWPARWWLFQVDVEPFGRDHASSGGSFDTGKDLMERVYDFPAPLPVPYDFINRAGDTKKMSASKGTGIAADEAVRVLPPEVLRYFVLGAPPIKRLYFDPVADTIKLADEFAALCARTDLTDDDKQTIFICTRGLEHRTVSRVPFTHLVASYQAALKDPQMTLDIMRRTEYKDVVNAEEETIRHELNFINEWLKNWAPEDVKFELTNTVDDAAFDETQKQFLGQLADKVAAAPDDADGEWFHLAIYELKTSLELDPKMIFSTLYTAIIGKTSGPRAGWFLSLLPRDWLIKRLRLQA